jgi:hypothetical protein
MEKISVMVAIHKHGCHAWTYTYFKKILYYSRLWRKFLTLSTFQKFLSISRVSSGHSHWLPLRLTQFSVPEVWRFRIPDCILSELRFFNFLLLPLTLQPAVGFGLSNNTSSFFPIYHQISPSSHAHNLKIFFCFFSASFPGSSSSSRPFQFFSENLLAHPILLHSLLVTQPTDLCLFIHF